MERCAFFPLQLVLHSSSSRVGNTAQQLRAGEKAAAAPGPHEQGLRAVRTSRCQKKRVFKLRLQSSSKEAVPKLKTRVRPRTPRLKMAQGCADFPAASSCVSGLSTHRKITAARRTWETHSLSAVTAACGLGQVRSPLGPRFSAAEFSVQRGSASMKQNLMSVSS